MAVNKVTEYVKKNKMIRDGDRLVLGVSGGADSVCLFRILLELQKEIGFSMKVVHIHHGIRGEEADRDQMFVQELCRIWNVPFKAYQFDVPRIAAEEHLSLEEAGRKVRYQAFFEELEAITGKVAVAHHADDNAETILMQLFRGSGIRGLGGMRAVNGPIIRPLLCLNRQEIEAYLEELGQPYCVDSTNASLEYARNRIRNQILPAAAAVNSRAVDHIVSAAEQLSEIESYLVWQTEKVWDQIKRQSVPEAESILLPLWFQKEHPVIQKRVIRKVTEVLAGSLKDVTKIHVEQVLQLFEKEVGKEASLPYQITARRLYGGVMLQKKGAVLLTPLVSVLKKGDRGFPTASAIAAASGHVFTEYPLSEGNHVLPDGSELRVTISSMDSFRKTAGGDKISLTNFIKKIKLEKDNCTKWFDYDKINGMLFLRTRKPGDYLVLHSSGGKKKLKDYLIDEKIPKESRDDILLLADGSHVLWIPGLRSSEDALLSDQTERVLKIEWKGGRKNHERAD